MNKYSFFNEFDDFINKILYSSVKLEEINRSSQLENENNKILWNLIDPATRFILLNQTVITNIWNVTHELNIYQTRLDWQTIPTKAKLILLSKKLFYDIANTSFYQWGWVNSNSDIYANITLKFLIKSESEAILLNIIDSLAKLKFDSFINITKLKLTSKHSFEDLNYIIMSILKFKEYKIKNDTNLKRFAPLNLFTPFDIINQVYMRTNRLLNNYLIK
jgi:hypothetical protein